MNRRIGMLAASVAMAATAFIIPASPASAHEDVCAGTGNATLSTGFGLPGAHPANNASFGFATTIAVCAPSGQTSLTAGGTVTGWCGLSSGRGTAQGDHDFAFTSQGTVLVLTGEVTGTVEVTPEVGTSGSCTDKSNTRFLVTGSVTLTHTTPPVDNGICKATDCK